MKMNSSYNASAQTFRFQGGKATRDQHIFDRESLKWAEFNAMTGELVCQGTDSMCKPTDEQLQEWQQVASRYAKAWGNRLDDLEAALYIRFGRAPKGGRSKNYVTGQRENGVSVYAAKYNLETGAIVFDGSLHGAGTLVFVKDRIPYLVTGQDVGLGSDGEPVLRHVCIVAELHYDETVQGFVR